MRSLDHKRRADVVHRRAQAAEAKLARAMLWVDQAEDWHQKKIAEDGYIAPDMGMWFVKQIARELRRTVRHERRSP